MSEVLQFGVKIWHCDSSIWSNNFWLYIWSSLLLYLLLLLNHLPSSQSLCL